MSASNGSAAPHLEIRGATVEYVNKRNDNHTLAIDDINFTVGKGEFVSIVGPSGCGKTTLLNAIDGLHQLTRGQIRLAGQVVTKPGVGRAVVFQSASLLPWRTVLGNVLYGCQLLKLDKKASRRRAEEYIELVGLRGFSDAYPAELSGGMQQRVNLARALATAPEMILFDEPFASLDAQMREFMQLELARIWASSQQTALFITHQISEAVFLSDRVVVFSAHPGRVRDILTIDLPRPRTLELKSDPRLRGYEEHIWAQIQEEGRRAGFISSSPGGDA